MQVFRSEIKVGLLIVISFAFFVAGVFLLSGLRTIWEDKKSLELIFPYADGITKGSPVWYAGFEVGDVTDIRIAKGVKDRIALTVKIASQAHVKKDSRTDIRSLGLMGAKYVEISPGTPEAPELAPGETLEGQSPSSLSEIMETGQQVATNVAQLIQEAKLLVQDLRSDSSVKAVIENANGLLVDMRKQVKEVGPILRTLNDTGANVKRVSDEGGKEVTALLRELRDTNRSVQKRLETVEAQLTRTLASASDAAGGAKSILTSSEEDITSLLKHLNETTKHLEALSDDLRSHPWKVVWKSDGDGDTTPTGTEQWREKGRIGPNGKK